MEGSGDGAPLKGWNKFPAAQEWLDKNSAATSDARQKFEQFMGAQAQDAVRQDTRALENEQDLYQQFLNWKESQPGASR